MEEDYVEKLYRYLSRRYPAETFPKIATSVSRLKLTYEAEVLERRRATVADGALADQDAHHDGLSKVGGAQS